MWCFLYFAVGYLSYVMSSFVGWHKTEEGEAEVESHAMAFFGLILFWPIWLPQILMKVWKDWQEKA